MSIAWEKDRGNQAKSQDPWNWRVFTKSVSETPLQVPFFWAETFLKTVDFNVKKVEMRWTEKNWPACQYQGRELSVQSSGSDERNTLKNLRQQKTHYPVKILQKSTNVRDQLGWVMWLLHGWLSLDKATWISHGINKVLVETMKYTKYTKMWWITLNIVISLSSSVHFQTKSKTQ